MMRLGRGVRLSALLLLAVGLLPLQVSGADYRLERIADKLSVPWGMVQLPNGDLLITERDGDLLRIADSGRGARVSLSGVPKVDSDGQGGLLDITLHPDFVETGLIYLSYARPASKGSQTAVGRARIEGDALVEWEDVFIPPQASGAGRHFGSRLAFDRDGFLYVTVGDRADRDRNPQDLSRVAGKIHRLHDDGRVPDDNPFSGSGALASVWSLGHRNPQGLVLDPETGNLLSHEHGPRGGDELNLITRGENYGWPLATFGRNYIGTRITRNTELDRMVSPLMHWTPSIAPSGLAIVQDPSLPDLRGKLLVGSLKFAEIHSVTLNPDRTAVESTAVIMETPGRVRNLYSGINGDLFVAITGSGLYKLVRD